MKLLFRICIGCLIVGLLALARAASPASRPSPVQYHEEVRVNPPLHLHVVTVDLTDPRVMLRVVRGADDPDGEGPWQTKLETVRSIATREKLAAAVNGSFFTGKDVMDVLGQRVPYFTGNWATASGWAMSDGVLWSKQTSLMALVVDAKGHVEIGRFGKLPANAKQVIGTGDPLLIHGKNMAPAKDLAPRSSVGIDREGKKLVMLVVDGRREEYSVGVTLKQEADELLRLGCWDAIGLDGGGSATMVMRDDVEKTVNLISRPSDGHDLPISLSIERPVANCFGVQLRDANP